MSKINAVRSEIQSKFYNDMKQLKKKDIIDRLETEIATAVKNSVATALEGIDATMNKMLSANNSIVYDNMKSEREIITNATAVAVAKRVDITADTDTVARALASHTRSSSASPTRKKEKRSNPDKTNPDAVMENSKVAK
jgi:methyl coenzyme M reductase beta subunit